MSTTPDVVTRQWFKEVSDEGREEAIDRLMAPTGTVFGLSGPGGPAYRRPGRVQARVPHVSRSAR